MGSAASAQHPQPQAREQQQRQVVVPSGPNEPVPEVRVAAKVTSYLRFNAPIDRASLEVEGRATRFKLVDPGEYTIALEMAIEPEPGERLIVRVRYKDGASPAYATFALVSHPTLVDKEVEVVRRPRTVEALEATLAEKDAQLAALRAVSGPAGLVFSGRLDLGGVQGTGPTYRQGAPWPAERAEGGRWGGVSRQFLGARRRPCAQPPGTEALGARGGATHPCLGRKARAGALHGHE
jgi:uncharacterized protein (TIGR02268 family)